MAQIKHFTFRIDDNLKEMAQKKAKEEFGMGLGTLMKLFLQSFVGKSSVKFYLNDEEFDSNLNQVLKSKNIKKSLKDLADSV